MVLLTGKWIQTIIPKGSNADYKSLIDFCQTWYNNDGEDSLFEELVIDNLETYSSWQNGPFSVGLCKIAKKGEKQKYDKKISEQLKVKREHDYLIINPTWNK